MLRLRIDHDDNPINPRKEFDNFGEMVTWHKRYNLGDVQPKECPEDWLASVPKGSVTLALYFLDHSCQSISCESFHDRWDSGQVGYITIPPDRIREEYKVKRISKKTRQRVTDCLRSEVRLYDQYMQGQVWGFTLEDLDTGDDDSCWGFYGEELSETGLAEHIPSYLQDLLRKAWDLRGTGNWVLDNGWRILETAHG
jgi:hypothetical protein